MWLSGRFEPAVADFARAAFSVVLLSADLCARSALSDAVRSGSGALDAACGENETLPGGVVW